jgi:putative copper export protein
MSTTLLALYAVVRGLIYIALLLLVGGQCTRVLIAGALASDQDVGPPIRDRARRLASRLLLPLLLLIIAHGALQVCSLLDPGDAVTVDIVRSVLGEGPWAHAWLLQVAAAIVLLAAFRFRVTRASAATLPGCVIVAVLIWAQTGMGHSGTNRWPWPLGRILDGIHILGAGIWLGTLGVLAIAALPLLRREARLPALARVVRGFSIYARVGVALVVISGTIAALVYAGSIELLLASTWGRLLLIKLAGMLGVMALGWYNWRVVTPALDTTDPAARTRLRVAIRLELLLALAMLAITTMLVVSPLPGEV